jgi:hypothetical protein
LCHRTRYGFYTFYGSTTKTDPTLALKSHQYGGSKSG